MTRQLASLAIASGLSFGGIVWAQDAGSTMSPPGSNDPIVTPRPDTDAAREKMEARPSADGLPAGITAKDLNDQEDIRSVLASAVNAAFTKGGFDDMVERFTTNDRKRIGEFAERDFAELDGRIEQIRQAWEQKYGQSFNLDNPQLFAGFVRIQEGEISDVAALGSSWPVKAKVKDGYGQPVGDRVSGTPTGAGASGQDRWDKADRAGDAAGAAMKDGRLGDAARHTGEAAAAAGGAVAHDAAVAVGVAEPQYLERGRNVAVVTVPTSHGMPGVRLSMIQEPVDDWRIDLPNQVTGQQLYENVKTALTHVGENVQSLPADVNEAYRKVGHCVLLAMHGIPLDAMKQMPTAGADTTETGR